MCDKVKTLEARWFWPVKGKKPSVPEILKDAGPEVRTDYYLPVIVGDVGIKWREKNLESKLKLKSSLPKKASRILRHVSVWQKQIILEETDLAKLHKEWVPVEKKRWQKEIGNASKLEFAEVMSNKNRYISLCIESATISVKSLAFFEKNLKQALTGWDHKKYPLNAKFAANYPDWLLWQ